MSKRPKFFVPMRVRYAETDAQGHVFFGNYLTYFDVAATEYVKTIGYSIADFLRAGTDFYYVQSHCDHKWRAYYDQVLHVHATVAHLGRTSFRFEFSAFERTSDRLIATGHIVAVVVEREGERPTPIPAGFRQAVENYERDGKAPDTVEPLL